MRSFECDEADDDVEATEELVVHVEGSVLEDVDLHAGEEPERGQALVDLGHHVELAAAGAARSGRWPP